MRVKVLLKEDEIPRQWYNLAADLPTPVLPPLGFDGNPIKPEDLSLVLPMSIIEQEVSLQRWINIPDEILEILYQWRPAPLRRAVYLEKALRTPARIYFKDEGVSPPGSHKPNTAVPQVWYNKQAGTELMTTETGAGQWGSALAYACALMGLKCRVYMVRISFDQKPFRKLMMNVWGAECVSSPSTRTSIGRAILEKDPDTPGSLGVGASESLEDVLSDPSGKTKYCLGSVLNHVLMHQTVIGLEAKKQLEKIGEKKVDTVIGCVGAESNFGGIAFPFVCDKINGAQIDIIPVEPTSCPTLTRGPFTYDYPDRAMMAPLFPMHSLGHDFVSPPIHAGGLRFHGMAPLVSAAAVEGLVAPRAVDQIKCYESAMLWARTEGFIPAPETSHAIAAVIDEAVKAREEGKEKVILFAWSGHGLMDLTGYQDYMEGRLHDCPLPEEDLRKSLKSLEGLPKAIISRTGKW
jgi:tryptophan synthase beta chain